MSDPDFIDMSDDEFRRYAAERPDEYPLGHADYVLQMRDLMNPGQPVRVWFSFAWPDSR